MTVLTAPLRGGFAAAASALGRNTLPIGSDHKVQVYKLETVEIAGTSRMTSAQLQEALGLVPGTPLDDDLVMSARTRLLEASASSARRS